MGVFARPDSPWWWLWLETTKHREKTEIRIGTTTAQRHDSRKLAEDRYHQRMNELAARLYKLPGALPAIRFAKYAEEYKPTLKLRKGGERELEILKTLTAHFGTELLTGIDQDRVRAFMAERMRDVSPSTVNREVASLKSMLRDAVPKYLNESPLAGMKFLRTTKPLRRLMTVDEEAKLLTHADPVETAFLLLGLDGLMRMGDILDLRRRDRVGEWVTVTHPKNDDAYEVALSPRTQTALDALGTEGDYYFDRYRGAKLERDRRRQVRKALIKLCERADVTYGKTAGGITFHWATRKTGATRLILERKIPIPIVQRQGGWKTPDVLLSIYAEAEREDQRRLLAQPVRSRKTRKPA